MVQVNITALMQLTHCFLKGMIERGQGRILNLSSVASFCAGPDMSIYYASKAFVRSFSEAVAEEVKGTGVTVTAICPGPTATGFEKAASMKQGSTMFKKAAGAKDVAKAGIKALEKGKVLCYPGAFVKTMNILSRLAPRSVTRKAARRMNH
ncbi:MAG: SDR family NAD(P)-dependent oxidoreductase [Lachnospiraceae bacterium]|nr:SDR family NAD(P)-dependent oxidoreductase [Lachnospiraceae bacterium]